MTLFTPISDPILGPDFQTPRPLFRPPCISGDFGCTENGVQKKGHFGAKIGSFWCKKRPFWPFYLAQRGDFGQIYQKTPNFSDFLAIFGKNRQNRSEMYASAASTVQTGKTSKFS